MARVREEGGRKKRRLRFCFREKVCRREKRVFFFFFCNMCIQHQLDILSILNVYFTILYMGKPRIEGNKSVY